MYIVDADAKECIKVEVFIILSVKITFISTSSG